MRPEGGGGVGVGIIADIEEEEAVKKALILRGDRARASEGARACMQTQDGKSNNRKTAQRSAGVSEWRKKSFVPESALPYFCSAPRHLQGTYRCVPLP